MVIATLAGLALIDATSIGTLVIPVWLLLASERPPARRLAQYLGAIAAFYFMVGIALTIAVRTGIDTLTAEVRTPVVLWPQLVVGVALFAVSWRFDSARRRRAGAPDRAVRWRARALDAQSSGRGLAMLAVSAGSIELFSMLPYLAAIGLIVSTGTTAVQWIPLLAGYCAVMIAPAAIAIVARSVAGERVEAMLARVDGFVSRHADSALGWMLGIVGFLLASDAATALFVE
ncbi:GAP family protein [Antrihabitans cavernicola]|uniref:GAP family protein n=1 Tax=Antrihabitans cavernicola TaxID=2495913 RepID=A0A5A7SGQ2_9NOCA|nr:GAP family protein [Spelaeibacter cavernicola]KAA0023391.1 hypothetical protein FOY51_08250 [Spelaeibacter cavernicola]